MAGHRAPAAGLVASPANLKKATSAWRHPTGDFHATAVGRRATVEDFHATVV